MRVVIMHVVHDAPSPCPPIDLPGINNLPSRHEQVDQNGPKKQEARLNGLQLLQLHGSGPERAAADLRWLAAFPEGGRGDRLYSCVAVEHSVASWA